MSINTDFVKYTRSCQEEGNQSVIYLVTHLTLTWLQWAEFIINAMRWLYIDCNELTLPWLQWADFYLDCNELTFTLTAMRWVYPDFYLDCNEVGLPCPHWLVYLDCNEVSFNLTAMKWVYPDCNEVSFNLTAMRMYFTLTAMRWI